MTSPFWTLHLIKHNVKPANGYKRTDNYGCDVKRLLQERRQTHISFTMSTLSVYSCMRAELGGGPTCEALKRKDTTASAVATATSALQRALSEAWGHVNAARRGVRQIRELVGAHAFISLQELCIANLLSQTDKFSPSREFLTPHSHRLLVPPLLLNFLPCYRLLVSPARPSPDRSDCLCGAGGRSH